MTVEFGILGPLQAVRDGVPLRLGGPRQRAVLARLLLAPGRVVPVDALIDDVWDGDPPETATKTVQKYVSALRQELGHGVLRTSGRGYSVHPEDGGVDAGRFEQLLAAGEHEAALALWRGDVLADLPDLSSAEAERVRLRELRAVAEERRIDDELRAGRHEDVVPVLQELAAEHSLRERLCGQLMLALYRSARQVEALQVFARHRRRLAEEAGLDPAAELVQLETAILRHDPSLDLPRPAAPPVVRGNLRPPVSSFVGREQECRQVLDALHERRLVTLTGPGGVGKTRLAAEGSARALAECPGGAWWVDLAGLTDPRLVVHQVALALSVGEEPGQAEEDTVLSALDHRGCLLLVLDNCEHLAERCAALVDRIARTCPSVHVLSTSRRPLGVDGEFVLPVTPLADRDAEQLFADRARLAGTPAEEVAAAPVADICRPLDGLPLALELAAAQLRVLGSVELAARLGDRLGFESRRYDAPPRQRTLREMVAWSVDLLPPPTRAVFARLGVFATTLTLDAAAAVCGEGDVLRHVTTLVDHSLLVPEPGAPSAVRYRLLDTLRLFALDRLSRSGEGERVRRAHAEFYLRLTQAAGAGLYGPDEQAWSDRLEAEEPNVHAALAWATDRDPQLALGLGIALWPYWDLRWRQPYGVAHLTSVLDTRAADVPDGLRAWARTAMADLEASQGEARLARSWAGEAVELFRRADDPAGLVTALRTLAVAEVNEGRLDDAERRLAEASARAADLGDTRLAAQSLEAGHFLALRRGDHHRAEQLGREELAAWTELGSRRGAALALRHVAVAVRQRGDLDEATRLCEAALAIWRELDDVRGVAHVQTTLADIARQSGELDRAVDLYEDAFVELCCAGDRRCTASTYKNLATVAAAQGDRSRSTALLQDAVRVRQELGDTAGLAECFDGIAADLAATGYCAAATVLLGAADRRREVSGSVATAEEEQQHARVVTVLEEALPTARRAELAERGRSMSVDEAVAYALALAHPPPAPLER